MAKQIESALRIIRRKQVEQKTGLSRSTIYAKFRENKARPQDFDPTFPQPISLGAGSVGWLEHEVDAWILGRVAASRQVA